VIASTQPARKQEETLADIFVDIPRRQTDLSDTASPLSLGGTDRRASDPDLGLDEAERASPLALDFARAVPEVPPGSETELAPDVTATMAPTIRNLAEIFKVAPVGQSSMIDPRTGMPALPRQRRIYG
jgi:hypothetical protein